MKDEIEITQSIVDSICNSIKDNTSVIDIGFGNTMLLKNLIKKNNIKSYTGVDIDKCVVEKAMRDMHIEYKTNKFDFICGNIDELSLQKSDAIVCSRLFHHLPVDVARQYIDILSNTLYDNGQLIIVDSIRDFSNRDGHYSYTPIFFINEISRLLGEYGRIIYSSNDGIAVNQFWKLIISLEKDCFSFEISTIGE